MTTNEFHGELTTAYGEDVVSYSTVALWVRRFSNGRESLEDDSRDGCPIAIVTRENIDAVRELVNDDPHVSIADIADVLDIPHGSAFTILRKQLKLKKVSSRSLAHELTATQRQHRVEIRTELLQKLV